MAGKNGNEISEDGGAEEEAVTEGGEETGTDDSTYALISTAYHLLQGAETIGMFVDDAREAGREEIADFLEETREEYIERAERAKELLLACLTEEGAEEEGDEEA